MLEYNLQSSVPSNPQFTTAKNTTFFTKIKNTVRLYLQLKEYGTRLMFVTLLCTTYITQPCLYPCTIKILLITLYNTTLSITFRFRAYLFAPPVTRDILGDEELLLWRKIWFGLGRIAWSPSPCGTVVNQVVTRGHKFLWSKDSCLFELGLLYGLRVIFNK